MDVSSGATSEAAVRAREFAARSYRRRMRQWMSRNCSRASNSNKRFLIFPAEAAGPRRGLAALSQRQLAYQRGRSRQGALEPIAVEIYRAEESQ